MRPSSVSKRFVPFACLKSIGKFVTKLDGSLKGSSLLLVVLSKLMLMLVTLSLMSGCISKGSVLAIVLLDVVVVVDAVVDIIVTGIVVAVNAAILVAFELLNSEAIASVDDLVVRIVVAFTVVDFVIRLVVVAIVGFVVRLVVDLSVDVDLEVSLVGILVDSWVVFSCFVLVVVVVVVVVCPIPKSVSLFTYWICWTGVSLWGTTVTEGARIPVQ